MKTYCMRQLNEFVSGMQQLNKIGKIAYLEKLRLYFLKFCRAIFDRRVSEKVIQVVKQLYNSDLRPKKQQRLAVSLT